jgi:radical SAM protein with 4Fe4S-binding SPASM domain
MDDFGYFPLDPALRFLHQTWHGCIAGRSLIGIRSNGDLLGCLSLGDGFIEGNLRQTSLRELWSSPTAFPRLRHKEYQLTGACAACPFASECRAGCTGIAQSATGDIGCNPYCIRAMETEEILATLTE